MATFTIDEFDTSIQRIARYVASTDEVPAIAIDGLVRHHLDSIGCALGSCRTPVCRAVVEIAASANSDNGASVIGLGHRTTPEYATLANSALIRYLDFNDNYLRNGGGHTSDLIPAVFAAAEQHHRSGGELLLGLHVGYEVFAALADAVQLRDRGWDYPLFIGIAAAAATAKVLQLPAEQIASAIAIAATPNVPLGITRVGPLANWKGLASSYAAMNGSFAARLAGAGITGPPHAIEGHRGLWALATGPMDLTAIGQPVGGRTAVERSSYKLFVAEFNAQGPVAIFADLHREGVKPDEIERIDIRTYEVAWSEIGGGQDDHGIKWDPQNKETADHSLPYMIAVALTDGDVSAESYEPARVLDPSLRPLMAKVTVAPDPAITARWNEEPAHDIEIRFTSGEVRRIRSSFPKGHPANPASDDELVEKFRRQAEPLLGIRAGAALLDELWSLPSLGDVDTLAAHYRRLDTSGLAG